MNSIFKTLSVGTLMLSGCMSAIAADAETWKDLGQGEWRDDMIGYYYFLSQYYSFPVDVQESEQTPGRFRVVNPYKHMPNLFGTSHTLEEDRYVIIDASDPKHVYMEMSDTDFIFPDGKSLMLWSVADDYYNNRYGNWDQADEDNVCGTLADGAITFPKLAIVVYDYAGGPTGDLLFRTANKDGKFRLRLPGAPLIDAEAAFNAYDADTDKLSYTLSLEQDVENVKYALIAGEYEPAMVTKIINGTIPSQETNESGTLEMDYPGDGVYTLIVVPYYNGEAKTPAIVTREFSYGNNEWEKVENGTLTDGILSSNELTKYGEFVIDRYTFPVEVERNIANPQIIRLVNPYGENYPMTTALNYDFDHNYYMVFDVTDPDCVLMETMKDGIGLNLSLGTMLVGSRAYCVMDEMEWTKEQVKEAGYGGKFENDRITFPNGSLRLMFADIVPTWYGANQDDSFELKLAPNTIQITGIEEVTSAISGEAVYYRLDGTKVAGELEPGLYIKVNGAETEKVIIR